SIEINNFRKLNNKVCIDMNQELLIVGKNNTGKTSIFEVFEKFLVVGRKFRFEDFNNSSISRKLINDIYYDYIKMLEENQGNKLEKTQLKELENKFPKITLDIIISV